MSLSLGVGFRRLSKSSVSLWLITAFNRMLIRLSFPLFHGLILSLHPSPFQMIIIVLKPANKVSFRYHAAQVRKSGFFNLRRLKCLRKMIPTDCLETLIHAYVSSRIDFYNICSMTILTISKIRLNPFKMPVERLLQEPVDLTLLVHNSLPYIGCR